MTGISLPAHFEIGHILYTVQKYAVEDLRYKQEGRRFYSLCAHWPLGRFSLAQKRVPGISNDGKRRPVRAADSLTNFMCRFSRNSSTSWSPNGLPRPYRDSFTVLPILYKMEVFIIIMYLNFIYRFLFQKENEVYQIESIPIRM